MKILLDLDGVLVDFVKGACEVHGRHDPYRPTCLSWAAGVFNMKTLWDMTIKEFWAPIKGHDFWANLDWMSDGYDILSICTEHVGIENIYLATSPCLDYESWSGKAEWVDKNVPSLRRRLMIGAGKELAAHADTVLIDDRNENIDKFIANGGHGFLFPRPWNRCCVETHAGRMYLNSYLKALV